MAVAAIGVAHSLEVMQIPAPIGSTCKLDYQGRHTSTSFIGGAVLLGRRALPNELEVATLS